MKANWSNLEDTVGLVYVHTGVRCMISIISVGSYKKHQVIEAVELEK